MAQETGIPMFLAERGAENYPDIEVGGPGACFPVERWNGQSYRLAGARTTTTRESPARCERRAALRKRPEA